MASMVNLLEGTGSGTGKSEQTLSIHLIRNTSSVRHMYCNWVRRF